MKDATASLPSASNMFTSTITTTSSSASATTNIYTPQPQTTVPHATQQISQPPIQEVKPPDGQRLAYRMDYVLKENGNTYISAITSHTAYWCNADMAYFMLTKIHPELEKHYAKPVSQPVPPTLHQQNHQQFNNMNVQVQQPQQVYQQYNYNQGYNMTQTQPQTQPQQPQQQPQHVPRPHPHYAHLQSQY